MFKTTVTAALVGAAMLGLSACDVKKTQEGNVNLPKYDVQKTQEGNVSLPKYDVKGPDVQVSKEEKTVTVPTVKTEEKTITVPNVNVTTAKEKEQGGDKK
ncbi:MAG TPA: hypothetical protein VFE82_00350 [Ramlibacter sp.]|jgi:hypothetical protein|uniref:hypothetical protein n=1 Tax=Ramlibacter sp. TaxID=1917967 RepID=UPI002D6CD8A7|nr:hypothetical protein [Ramlibacter sp.]HZY16894.1 hypothetical protein [Ramlibacter sp.]